MAPTGVRRVPILGVHIGVHVGGAWGAWGVRRRGLCRGTGPSLPGGLGAAQGPSASSLPGRGPWEVSWRFLFVQMEKFCEVAEVHL